MKILYVTTVGSTMEFFMTYIKELLDAGHDVDIATNESDRTVPVCFREWGCKVYKINTSRTPFSKGNLYAIKELNSIVKKEKYNIVHCHTPIAAMCTRLACRKIRKSGTRVIYTAHGFHFYKGSPLKNWLLFYPVEKICAHFTDVLITMNKDDYDLAKKRMKAKLVEYVPGVGIELEKFHDAEINRRKKRQEFSIPENAILLFSAGELNVNKNHELVIRAIADMDVYYLIAGRGVLQERLQRLVDELGLTSRVQLIGYRRDIVELYKISDIYVLPSFREGLNVSIMEAMASGLPVVCSRIRGNVDLIDENGGGLFQPHSIEECKTTINEVMKSDMKGLGKNNLSKVKKFAVRSVNDKMKLIYGID